MPGTFRFVDIQSIKHEEDDDSSTVDEAYYCRICESIFDLESELATHEINFHSDKLNNILSRKNITFPCSYCNKIYFTKFSLHRHTESRHKSFDNQNNNSPGTNFSTQKTTRTVKKNNLQNTVNNLLAGPMNNKTPANYTCSYCNENYPTSFSLHRHVELQHKPLKQQILNNTEIRNILNRTSYNVDSTNVSCISQDDKKFCCPYCPKKYKSSSGLSDHKRTHLGKYIKCDRCTFSTNYKRNLRIHQSLVHDEAYDYQCKYCGKQYNIRKELTKHERRRHIELLPTESYFKCNRCPRIYSTQENLLKHLTNHPSDINSTLFNCTDCSYTSKQKSNLTQHYKLHHQSGYDHQCQTCHKKYKLLKSLKYHIKTKHDSNFSRAAFECDVCKKKFPYKDSVRKHMPIHMRLVTL